MKGGLMNDFEILDRAEDLTPDFPQRWRAAVDRVRGTQGTRDRLRVIDKDFMRPRALAWLGILVLSRARLRGVVGKVLPSYAGEEWRIPGFYLDQGRLAAALPVLKILDRSSWLIRTHAAEPGQLVIHNFRDPAAFLRSWRHRYVDEWGGGPEASLQQVREKTGLIWAHYGVDPARFETFSEAALLEGGLWRWRYMNETLYDALKDSPRYLTTTYAEYDANPVQSMRPLFDAAGLEMTDTVARKIEGMQNVLFKPQARKDQNSALYEDVCARVLEGSSILKFVGR